MAVKRLIPILCILIVMVLFFDKHCFAEEDHSRKGKLYYKKGEYDKALAEYNKLLTINPDSAVAHYNLGTVYDKLEQYRQAINHYKKAIQLKSDLAPAYFELGRLTYYVLGETKDAILYLQKASEINPNNHHIYTLLGDIHKDSKSYTQSVRYFEKALQLQPRDAYTHNALGIVLGQLNQYKKAITHFREAIEIDPHFANAYFNRALAYYASEQYQKAILNFERAKKLYHMEGNLKGIQLIEEYFNKCSERE